MNCQKCNTTNRIVSISAKCSDCCFTQYKHYDNDGYVPSEFGVGGGDYVEFKLCIECGTIQGKFPLPEPDGFIEECVEFRKEHDPDYEDNPEVWDKD